jgi:hypothetical protein
MVLSVLIPCNAVPFIYNQYVLIWGRGVQILQYIVIMCIK